MRCLSDSEKRKRGILDSKASHILLREKNLRYILKLIYISFRSTLNFQASRVGKGNKVFFFSNAVILSFLKRERYWTFYDRLRPFRIVDEPFETYSSSRLRRSGFAKRKNCCEILGKIRKNGEMYLLV